MSLREIFLTALSLHFAYYAALVASPGHSVWADEHTTVRPETTLEKQAAELARHPFQASPPLPKALADLDYDDYRLIAYEPARAVWKDEARPFWLEFFHRGYIFRDDVTIRLDDGRGFKPLAFNPAMFQYRGVLESLAAPGALSGEVDFAGFRVLGRFKSSRHFQELASFLGASYFRAVGEGQVYGTSARGLAIDIGLSKAEEFPVFREFWIERPAADAKTLKFSALLDSSSVTGAYEFVLNPGPATTLDVRAKIFFRKRPEKIGLVPMSSMWMWGKGKAAPRDERRPEVHDCDGLLIRSADNDWTWRSLTRLNYPSISRYDQPGLRGFGLVQRERSPERYRDDEAKYHLRPTVWIEPQNAWPAGTVELLELPAEHEGIDNIAAWWTPKAPLDVDRPLELAYRVSFQSDDPQDAGLARVVDVRAERRDDDSVEIDVTFAGGSSSATTNGADLMPEVDVNRSDLLSAICRRAADGAFRVSIHYRPHDPYAVEVRAVLKSQGKPFSETWRYLCRT
jgi:glucans biosynthesis protein